MIDQVAFVAGAWGATVPIHSEIVGEGTQPGNSIITRLSASAEPLMGMPPTRAFATSGLPVAMAEKNG